MSAQSDTAADFARKLKALVTSHGRFVVDFENSLKNASHFLELADRAMEKEPESTVHMLQQIREIDLLGHLQQLCEEFDGLRTALAASPYWSESVAYQAQLDRLSERYAAMQGQALDQLNRIDALLEALET